MTMRERIARALWNDNNSMDAEYDDLSKAVQGVMLKRADAVLNAMREPTEAMQEAGAAVISGGANFAHDRPLPTLGNAYRAMIDAALSEGMAEE